MSEFGTESKISTSDVLRGLFLIALAVSKAGIALWLVADGFLNNTDPIQNKVWKIAVGVSLGVESGHSFLKGISRPRKSS